MKIAVFGTGGVGGYFGSRLAQSGAEVVFIARGEHLKAIQTHGLKVESILGDFVIQPVQATDDPATIGGVDVVLLGVKAWQVAEAAQAMQPLIASHTCVLPLQNGISAPDILAQALGKSHVLGGLCQISAFVAEAGRIRHVGIEPLIAFGELDNQTSQRVARLRQVFERSGVKVEVPANILAAMWEKYLFIAPLSGVGAVTGAPVGVMRSLSETRQAIEQLMRELVAVAHKRGVKLASDAIQRKMAFIDGIDPSTTPSMQRDMAAGRPSELDALLGTLARLGTELGVPTPTCELIYALLLPRELRARRQLDY